LLARLFESVLLVHFGVEATLLCCHREITAASGRIIGLLHVSGLFGGHRDCFFEASQVFYYLSDHVKLEKNGIAVL
jgi:hypothetical protein